MERRKSDSVRSSPLPSAFLKMVNEVFSTNFDESIQVMKKITKDDVYFDTNGEVYPSEVVLALTLIQGKNLSATTIYASSDYDPKASSPTVQDVLATCVDAIGSVLLPLLDPKNESQLETLTNSSLSALAAELENIPLAWTSILVEKQKIFVKLDKANPKIDKMADEWLQKHDPDGALREIEEEEEVKKLFVTGPRGAKKPGSIH
jgi:hypothetical protein